MKASSTFWNIEKANFDCIESMELCASHIQVVGDEMYGFVTPTINFWFPRANCHVTLDNSG